MYARSRKICICLLSLASFSLAQSPLIKLGAGIGIPYGVIGGGAEIGVSRVSILGGLGYALYGVGWSVGGRVYLLPPTDTWSPHVTAVYGTTVAYQLKYATGGVASEGTLKGAAVYAGVDQDIARPGGSIMTYGVGFITHEALPAGLRDKDIGLPVKFIFAWNYRIPD